MLHNAMCTTKTEQKQKDQRAKIAQRKTKRTKKNRSFSACKYEVKQFIRINVAQVHVLMVCWHVIQQSQIL